MTHEIPMGGGGSGIGIDRKIVFKSVGWACTYSGVISQLSMFPVVFISGSFNQRCKFSYCSPAFHKVVTAYTRIVWLLSSWFATEVSSPHPMPFFTFVPFVSQRLSGCEVAFFPSFRLVATVIDSPKLWHNQVFFLWANHSLPFICSRDLLHIVITNHLFNHLKGIGVYYPTQNVVFKCQHKRLLKTVATNPLGSFIDHHINLSGHKLSLFFEFLLHGDNVISLFRKVQYWQPLAC